MKVSLFPFNPGTCLFAAGVAFVPITGQLLFSTKKPEISGSEAGVGQEYLVRLSNVVCFHGIHFQFTSVLERERLFSIYDSNLNFDITYGFKKYP